MPDPLDLALGLVTAASSASTARATADEVVAELRDQHGVAAVAVHVREPLSGRHLALASDGYPGPVLDHLGGPGFLEDDVGYRLLVTDPTRRARCWRDVEGYTSTPSVRDVFGPAGFCGGATARLVTRDGRWTGDLHVSARTEAGPAPDVVAALHHAAPALAAAVDGTRWLGVLSTALSPGEAACLVPREGGPPHPLPGRVPLPVDPGLLRAVRARRRDEADGTWYWRGPPGWYRVRLLAVAGGTLVAGRPGDLPGGLTPRELEVLSLLAEGASNHALARRLGISERTAAHHVEHVLAKCGAPSRAAAAARAVRDGWRLLPG